MSNTIITLLNLPRYRCSQNTFCQERVFEPIFNMGKQRLITHVPGRRFFSTDPGITRALRLHEKRTNKLTIVLSITTIILTTTSHYGPLRATTAY